MADRQHSSDSENVPYHSKNTTDERRNLIRHLTTSSYAQTPNMPAEGPAAKMDPLNPDDVTLVLSKKRV